MNLKKFFLTLGITLLILVVVFLCITLFSSTGKKLNFLDECEGSQRNILVVGVDKDGVRADVIMLFCTDKDEKTIDIVSIPRDTKVELDNGNTAKINACIGREDGEALLADRVRELTGRPVNSFCKVNFEGLRNIVDILGGVEYDVPCNMDYDDPAQDLHIHLKKGPQMLNGADVEGLVRFRSGYANADLGRIDTQQDFLKEVIKQKLQFKYILKLSPVMSEVKKNFTTDLSAMDVLSLGMGLSNAEVRSVTLPGVPKYIDGASYYVADKDAADLIDSMLQEDISEE